MARDRAAYMRDYRARQRTQHEHYDAMKPEIGRIKTEASTRIRELEAENAALVGEIKFLKREIAARIEVQNPVQLPAAERFNTQPFRGPILKSGKPR